MTPKIQVFEYNGHNISFDFGNGNRMINATEMAKAFGKKPAHFLRIKQTQDFINVLIQVANLQLEKIIKVIHGGNQHGTWMHEKLALKFAAWLSPEFEVWVYDKIHELLQKGYTNLQPQSKSFQNITFIYFFKAVNLNRVKIGMSRNVHQRLGKVQTTSPVELELIKIIRTNDRYPNDVSIHALFQNIRLHNEWFELTLELQAFIDELDSVPIGEAAAYYEEQLTLLRQQLGEERQKVTQKNKLIQSLIWQLGQVQQEYQQLLAQWQERKETTTPHSFNNNLPQSDFTPTIDARIFYLLQSKKYYRVNTKDIVYVKSVSGGAICVLSNGEMYRSELSLRDSLKQLPNHSFMKVHKSYVINLRHLNSIDLENRKLTLCKTTELHISIKYMKLLVERLQFLKKKDNC